MSEKENVVSFIGERVRRSDRRFGALRAHVGARADRIEGRVMQVERRLTASTHLEQGLVAHMASLHESMDNARATPAAFDTRSDAIEAR